MSRSLRVLLFTIVILGVFTVQPAVAEETTNNATGIVCGAEKLPDMVEGFFELTTGFGVLGLVIVWQGDSLLSMFTLSPEQKKGLKRHKRTALKSTIVLLTLGPLYTVAGSTMGLPMAECIDLVPW